jgi:hypothetical protein
MQIWTVRCGRTGYSPEGARTTALRQPWRAILAGSHATPRRDTPLSEDFLTASRSFATERVPVVRQTWAQVVRIFISPNVHTVEFDVMESASFFR